MIIFKRVNDQFGHRGGDTAIIEVAKVLKSNLREIDIAGRYGGEEFAVLLVNTNSEQAFKFCERVRQQISENVIKYENKKIQFTVSLGIYEVNQTLENHSQWIEGADQGLYYCKENGRKPEFYFHS